MPINFPSIQHSENVKATNESTMKFPCCIPPLLGILHTVVSFRPSTSYRRKETTGMQQTTTTTLGAGSGDNNSTELFRQLYTEFDYEGRLDSDVDGFRCGFVSIIGAPNMGKSTLLNALLQEDLSIATARPQTTRHAILGLLKGDSCQVCLVDTPGVIDNPAYKLQEGMMEAVMGAFHDADVLLVVTDVFSTPIPNDTLFQKVQHSNLPTVVVVNKIDLAEKVNLETSQDKISIRPEQAIAVWRQLLPNALAILPAAANNGSGDPGVAALRTILTGGPDVPAALRNLGRPIPGMFPPEHGDGATMDKHSVWKNLLPLSPPLYDQDVLTDRTERFVASEMIRAALFECLKKELPYCCEVQVTEFKEPKANQKKAVTRISANVIVERVSQKVIVVGKGGEQIKQVGIKAREQLQDFFQSQVHLNLSVKVDKDWRKKESKLKAYGYLK